MDRRYQPTDRRTLIAPPCGLWGRTLVELIARAAHVETAEAMLEARRATSGCATSGRAARAAETESGASRERKLNGRREVRQNVK